MTGTIHALAFGEPAPGSSAVLESGPGRAPSGTFELPGPDGRPRLRLAQVSAPHPGQTRLQLELPGGQHLYGLGQGGLPFDRLGATRRLLNCHVNHAQGGDIAIPLLLSSAGWGLFVDAAALAWLDPGRSYDRTWLDYTVEQSGLTVHVLAASDLKGVLGLVADLLGHAPMPPRWALGYMQSTRHFADTEELLGLAATFRAKRLPLDSLALLSTYGEAQGWNKGVGHLEWNERLLPEPERLTEALRAADVALLLHEYPVLHPDSPLHAEAVTEGHLLDTGYPEARTGEQPPANYHEGQRYLALNEPATGAWWWARHRHLVEAGVAGWWLDGGEGPAADSDGTAVPTALHNRYDIQRQAAFAAGEARDRPDARPFLLCRSGGAGMQRFSAACWSGDVDASFATLEAQIAIGLNTGLSGVPFWGTDIGGYYPATREEAELFVRWFQMGAFCPVFRSHGRSWRQRLPWAFGPEIEAICRHYLDLRYRLMPYTYSLAWQAHREGLPLMRPLALEWPDEPDLGDLATAWLWGDQLLVAPVTRAGATHWPVRLPPGAWHAFDSHERHAGGRGITVEAPLARLPLFVRAGAILPLMAPARHLKDGPPDEITLRLYPEGRSSFSLYEDDGRSTAYRGGAHALTDIACDAEPGRILVHIAAPRGDAACIPAARRWRLELCLPDRPVRVERLADSGALPLAWTLEGGLVTVEPVIAPASIRLLTDRKPA
jgi:alpha-glucosidase (family GH31 glycosyl hydrolase)